jgi:hypothetical protein
MLEILLDLVQLQASQGDMSLSVIQEFGLLGN